MVIFRWWLPRAIVLASCALFAVVSVVAVVVQWPFDDMHSYLGAAERLLAGEPLYISGVATSQLYLYSPWFAFVWIPMTQLPALLVEVVWAAILLASLAAAMWPYRRSLAGVCLALLLGALLFRTVGWGNVQPLLVAVLAWTLPSRAGPWALGVMGSLKPLTLAFVVIYAWRREWRSAGIALGLAAILWAPALLFDLSSYPSPRGLNLYDTTLLLVVVPFLVSRLDRPAGDTPAVAA